MAIMYSIYGEQNGRQRHLFNWCRDEQSGIARAQVEAAHAGQVFTRFWAVPFEPAEYVE